MPRTGMRETFPNGGCKSSGSSRQEPENLRPPLRKTPVGPRKLQPTLSFPPEDSTHKIPALGVRSLNLSADFSKAASMSAPVRPSGLFVTGTDTGVGKTHVASLIARQLVSCGLRVGVYKPVCSGAEFDSNGLAQWDDIERLREAVRGGWQETAVCGKTLSGEPLALELLSDDAICPQRFLAPLAPPLAARAEGRTVDLALLESGADHWSAWAEVLIIEGAGGLLAPVSETTSAGDLARQFGYPLIIVARCGLGTINHTLLTIEAAQRRGLSVAGIVLNQARLDDDLALATDNAAEITARGGVPVLGVISWRSTAGLQRDGRTVTIAWQNLAGCSMSDKRVREGT